MSWVQAGSALWRSVAGWHGPVGVPPPSLGVFVSQYSVVSQQSATSWAAQHSSHMCSEV